jgi:ADP-ribosylglycohydrolase
MKYISKDSSSYIEKAVSLSQKCRDIKELYEKYYETLLVEWNAQFQLKPSMLPSEATTSCDLREQVPAALAMFYFCKGDPKETIIAAVNFGRDTDTIATTAGSIAGAFGGIKSMPTKWVDVCLQANPDPNLNDLCEKLYLVLRKEIEVKKEQLGYLEKMV